MAKETVTEKYIKKAVKAAKEELSATIINDNVLVGVQFDETATKAMVHIANALQSNAQACQKNAEALNHLACTLNTSGVCIDSLIKVG